MGSASSETIEPTILNTGFEANQYHCQLPFCSTIYPIHDHNQQLCCPLLCLPCYHFLFKKVYRRTKSIPLLLIGHFNSKFNYLIIWFRFLNSASSSCCFQGWRRYLCFVDTWQLTHACVCFFGLVFLGVSNQGKGTSRIWIVRGRNSQHHNLLIHSNIYNHLVDL